MELEGGKGACNMPKMLISGGKISESVSLDPISMMIKFCY